jgi:hypothetical protein
MYNLSKFSTSDMDLCADKLKNIADRATSMEEAAENIVQHLYENMSNGDGQEKTVALVRLYLVVPYDNLPADLKTFAGNLSAREPLNPNTMCLTLLGTKGKKDEWNSRFNSAGHKCIPLASENFVKAIPMISSLISQLGLELKDVVDNSILYDESKEYNVFYVPEAKNSPLVPHQADFVVPDHIKSVIGFGGVLPSGKLFVVIMFSNTMVPSEASNKFKTLAQSVKSALLPYEHMVFRQER